MKIKLTNVRLSFPDLFEAVQYQGKGPFNYQAQFLVPADSALKKQIDDAITAVAVEKWGNRAKALLTEILPDKKACCWIDGNRREYDGYAGMWALTAKRKQEKGRPLLINTNKTPLAASDGKLYAGCYVNASVEIWAQDTNDGKGIRCGLLGVQFAKDGEAFAGGAAADESDFEDLGEGVEADDLV